MDKIAYRMLIIHGWALSDPIELNPNFENCIVESRDTIRANTTYIGTPENIKIVIEKNERYTL